MVNKKTYAQFFSPHALCKKMADLCQNVGGRVLEPSCGDNRMVAALRARNFSEDITGIELDAGVISDLGTLHLDFFSVPLMLTYNTIIGNPPYIANKAIPESTRNLPVFKQLQAKVSRLTNLYNLFILKAVMHLEEDGELVFIVPRDWTNCTSGIEVRRFMDSQGVVTKFVDLSDRKIFRDAQPDTCVFRYVKGFEEPAVLKLVGDNYIDVSVTGGRLGDFTKVHVGCVAKNKKQAVIDGILPILGSNRQVERYHSCTDWIRPPNGIKCQLFVNCKTRQEKPFFTTETPMEFDGSLLGIECEDPKGFCDRLNAVDWRQQGMKHGGRFIFSQRGLTEALI